MQTEKVRIKASKLYLTLYNGGFLKETPRSDPGRSQYAIIGAIELAMRSLLVVERQKIGDWVKSLGEIEDEVFCDALAEDIAKGVYEK